MGSHLSSIGMPVANVDAFRALSSPLLADGARVTAAGGWEVVTWADPSGSRITFTVPPGFEHGTGDAAGYLPSFAGHGSVTLTLTELPPAGGTLAYGELADSLGETHDVAVNLEDALLLGTTDLGVERVVPLTGLVEQIEVHADASAWKAARGPGSPFIAIGMIDTSGPDDEWEPSAQAVVVGTVISVAGRTNEYTATDFVHVCVANRLGTIDLAVDAYDLAAPLLPGQVVRAVVSLVTRARG